MKISKVVWLSETEFPNTYGLKVLKMGETSKYRSSPKRDPKTTWANNIHSPESTGQYIYIFVYMQHEIISSH